DRGAELVRGVGGEADLGLEGGVEAIEEGVDRGDRGADLVGALLGEARALREAADARGLAAGAIEGAEGAADDAALERGGGERGERGDRAVDDGEGARDARERDARRRGGDEHVA